MECQLETETIKKGTTLSIIIPLLWFMRASSKGISFWLNTGIETEDYLEGSFADRAFFTVLMTLGFLILITRRIDWVRLFKSNYPFLLFFAYMGLSILWSGFPKISFRRWVHTIGDLIMILVIITELNPVESLAKMMNLISLILLSISIILIKYYRDLGVVYDRTGTVEMWTGVATHKNTLGQISLLAGLYCLWDLTRKKNTIVKKMVILAIFAMVIFLLQGSQDSLSATSLITFIIGCFVLVLLRIFKGKPQLALVSMLILLMFSGLYSYAPQFNSSQGGVLSVVAGSMGRDNTLTGRTELWTELIQIGSQHSPIGTGYGSFWIGDLGHDLWEKFTWKPEQGHNGYIDIYVELGIIGLLFLSFMIFMGIKGIKRALEFDYQYGCFRCALLIVALIHNYTESSFGRPSHLMWLLFLLSIFNISDYQKFKKRPRVKHLKVSR